jgi:hypothetical protein
MKRTIYNCNVRTCGVAAELLYYQIVLRIAVFLPQSGEERPSNVRIASDKLLNRFVRPLDHVWILTQPKTGTKVSERMETGLDAET